MKIFTALLQLKLFWEKEKKKDKTIVQINLYKINVPEN